MARIGVWKTLAGAAFVTPDAIGFGFYNADELGKLQADLEAGLSVNKAAGFSGSIYPLRVLKSVEVQEKSKRVIVRYRDLLLTEHDDFNFTTVAACKEFCEVLLENLGPDWQRQLVAHRSRLALIILTPTALAGLLSLALSIMVLISGPPAPRPGAPEPVSRESHAMGSLMCVGISLVPLALGGFGLWFAIRHPAKFDMIQPT